MEFYPPKYWGLDPIYHACVKLTIADVLNLTEHPTCKGMYALILSVVDAGGDSASSYPLMCLAHFSKS